MCNVYFISAFSFYLKGIDHLIPVLFNTLTAKKKEEEEKRNQKAFSLTDLQLVLSVIVLVVSIWECVLKPEEGMILLLTYF